MTRMERLGSASARRPAMTHAAVPPESKMKSVSVQKLGMKGDEYTSSNDNVDLLDAISEFVVNAHGCSFK